MANPIEEAQLLISICSRPPRTAYEIEALIQAICAIQAQVFYSSIWDDLYDCTFKLMKLLDKMDRKNSEAKHRMTAAAPKKTVMTMDQQRTQQTQLVLFVKEWFSSTKIKKNDDKAARHVAAVTTIITFDPCADFLKDMSITNSSGISSVTSLKTTTASGDFFPDEENNSDDTKNSILSLNHNDNDVDLADNEAYNCTTLNNQRHLFPDDESIFTPNVAITAASEDVQPDFKSTDHKLKAAQNRTESRNDDEEDVCTQQIATDIKSTLDKQDGGDTEAKSTPSGGTIIGGRSFSNAGDVARVTEEATKEVVEKTPKQEDNDNDDIAKEAKEAEEKVDILKEKKPEEVDLVHQGADNNYYFVEYIEENKACRAGDIDNCDALAAIDAEVLDTWTKSDNCIDVNKSPRLGIG